ncbi:MAG: hypothetical protein IKO10_18695 [Lachnospiraceae bacterium]|nr:hypothetical protein [Lachnospiraceae bacterium]
MIYEKSFFGYNIVGEMFAAANSVLGSIAADQIIQKGNEGMFDNSVFTITKDNLNSRITQATHYLEEYEKEVARAQGAAGYVFRNKEDALGRIKMLMEYDQNDDRILSLYDRAKKCVKGGAGNIVTVDPTYMVYLENEENLRKHYADVSEKAWNDFLAANTQNKLERMYPTPDFKKYILDDVKDKVVILDNVRYPENQFMGSNGEYIWCGTRSDGMYFIRIDGREWLGPYEAVKRYRRQVDTTMMEVKEWTIIGKITELAMESPDANETQITPPIMAWEVEPLALYVPGHIMAVYDESGERTGKFIDEEKLEELKDAFYTVKEVPDDVTPERLVEIFMTAIKEKNYPLYLDCIDPERRDDPNQLALIMYHWDLHQERFHGEYIHAMVDPEKTVTKVVQGYDDNSIDTFFLDEDEQKKIKEAYGERIEEAYVQTSSIDKNGKQIGSPAKHTLKRVGDGRWYISTYEIRF